MRLRAKVLSVFMSVVLVVGFMPSVAMADSYTAGESPVLTQSVMVDFQDGIKEAIELKPLHPDHMVSFEDYLNRWYKIVLDKGYLVVFESGSNSLNTLFTESGDRIGVWPEGSIHLALPAGTYYLNSFYNKNDANTATISNFYYLLEDDGGADASDVVFENPTRSSELKDENAARIKLGQTGAGSLSRAIDVEDSDLFRLDISEKTPLMIRIKYPNSSCEIVLLDSKFDSVLNEDGFSGVYNIDSNNHGKRFATGKWILNPGTYYIRVASYVPDSDITTANLYSFDFITDFVDSDNAQYTFSDIYSENVYTGSLIVPNNVTVKNKLTGKEYVKDVDYIIEYPDEAYDSVGEHIITFHGIGSCYGEQSFRYEIVPASIVDAKVRNLKSEKYTGKVINPIPELTFNNMNLKLNTDYKLSYKNNKNCGLAKITITGIGNFTGTKVVNCRIIPANITDIRYTMAKYYTYKGKALKPKPKLTYNGKKLKLNKDYKLSYKNNKRPGTATITVKGMGNFKGKGYINFKIK